MGLESLIRKKSSKTLGFLGKFMFGSALAASLFLAVPNVHADVSNKISGLEKITRNSIKGKALRTYRWDNILTKAEQKYKIPAGLLKGLVMRESRGDPLALNDSLDGGAGLYQFQPGVARSYGLKVLDDCRSTSADYAHGKKLRKFLRSVHYNYDRARAVDERFDVIKSTDAAARFLKRLYKRHGSWAKALSAYNRGRPARNPFRTRHVRGVYASRNYYLKHVKGKHSVMKKRAEQKRPKKYKQRPVRNMCDRFHFVTFRGGMAVWKTRVMHGEYPYALARKFNKWDEKYAGNRYRHVKHTNIVGVSGRYIPPDKYTPGMYVYIKARRRF